MTDIKKEYRACIRFFLENLQYSKNSIGLVKDIVPSFSNRSSIAGSGYYFSALVLAIKENIISYDAGIKLAELGLRTLENMEAPLGFFYHFYDINNAKHLGDCEVSDIDTSILFLNLIVAAEFFKGSIKERTEKLIGKADWLAFLDKEKNVFLMAIDKQGKLFGYWDHYAEQLMVYVLAAGSQYGEEIGDKPYYSFIRDKGSYQGIDYIYSWQGSLFTYQYSQQFIDFRDTVDKEGTDWFLNSVNATKADKLYCHNHPEFFQSYQDKAFGLTACLTDKGYRADFGAGLMGEKEIGNDGTVSPSGALGSLSFLNEEVLEAYDYYMSLPKLLGPYGLYDSFNLNHDEEIYTNGYVSINKGITMVSIANYLDETIWKLISQSEIIKKGLEVLGIRKRGN